MSAIVKDLKEHVVKPFTDLGEGGASKIVPNILDCKNFLEFTGCCSLAILSHANAAGSMNWCIIFVVLYIIYGNMLKVRLRANPALSFADYMLGNNGAGCDVFKQVVFQVFGYAAGLWLAGLIFDESVAAAVAESAETVKRSADASFAMNVFNEIVSGAVLTWLWMHVHDDDQKDNWGQFLGLAAGLALWVGYEMKADGAHLNSAEFAGKDFGKRIGAWRDNAWSVDEWALFFAPIVAAFLTSLVYTHFRK